MTKMDWRRAQLHGRRTTDYRLENDVADRASKWLAAAERRQMQQRRIALTSSSTISVQKST